MRKKTSDNEDSKEKEDSVLRWSVSNACGGQSAVTVSTWKALTSVRASARTGAEGQLEGAAVRVGVKRVVELVTQLSSYTPWLLRHWAASAPGEGSHTSTCSWLAFLSLEGIKHLAFFFLHPLTVGSLQPSRTPEFLAYLGQGRR